MPHVKKWTKCIAFFYLCKNDYCFWKHWFSVPSAVKKNQNPFSVTPEVFMELWFLGISFSRNFSECQVCEVERRQEILYPDCWMSRWKDWCQTESQQVVCCVPVRVAGGNCHISWEFALCKILKLLKTHPCFQKSVCKVKYI